MTFLLVDTHCSEWAHMWQVLADRENGDTACLSDGEVWQYMGTSKVPAPKTSAAKVAHSFRHRHHPKTSERVYMSVAPSDEWLAENADAVAKLADCKAEEDIPF